MDFLNKALNETQGGENKEALAGIAGGLNSVLSQQNKEGGSAPANQDQISNLMGTVSSAINQDKSANTDSNQLGGVLGQLKDTLGQTQQQAQKEGSSSSGPLDGLMNVANNALGGGAAGEKKEGVCILIFAKLSSSYTISRYTRQRYGGLCLVFREPDVVLFKAIDMFQERVLKAGDQSNESAIEQQVIPRSKYVSIEC